MLIENWPPENLAGMLFLDFVAGLFFSPSRSYRRHSFSVYPSYLSFAVYGADPSAPVPHQAVHQPSVLSRHAPNSYTNLFTQPNAIFLGSPCLCKYYNYILLYSIRNCFLAIYQIFPPSNSSVNRVWNFRILVKFTSTLVVWFKILPFVIKVQNFSKK